MYNVNNLIRNIRQNKKRIIIIIAMFAGIVLIVQVLNGIAKGILENRSTVEDKTNMNTSSIYQPNKTILSNTTVNNISAKENTEIIDNFINYCNNGEIENAYNLLTDECKENLFNNVNSFKKNYYNKIFKEKKEYNLQSWITYSDRYTYKVRFTENLLATGNSNSNSIEDYITIINSEDRLGLNINYYIGREYLNSENKINNNIIKITYRDIYKDKEVYGVKVTNNLDNDILLDSLNTTTGIQLLGDNNVEYQVLINELSILDVTVPTKNTKLIKIKFSKEYNPRRKANKIIFSDIILDAEKHMSDPDNEENKTSINIEI